MSELWRPIPGFEGYEASDQGRIRSFRPFHGHPGPRILKPFVRSKQGHLAVWLLRNGERKCTHVHRAVLAAHVGPPPPDAPITRHLDGDPTNNQLSNLRYGTVSQNGHDAVRHGTHNNGRKTHCPSGHPYDELNTYWAHGWRKCRTCQRERNRRAGAKRRRSVNV